MDWTSAPMSSGWSSTALTSSMLERTPAVQSLHRMSSHHPSPWLWDVSTINQSSWGKQEIFVFRLCICNHFDTNMLMSLLSGWVFKLWIDIDRDFHVEKYFYVKLLKKVLKKFSFTFCNISSSLPFYSVPIVSISSLYLSFSLLCRHSSLHLHISVPSRGGDRGGVGHSDLH